MPLFTAISALIRRKRPAEAPLPAQTPDEQVLGLLEQALADQGVATTRTGGRLRLGSGIELQPQFLEAVRSDRGSVRTATRIVATHASHFPEGLPEYQHAAGDTPEASVVDGFKAWSRMDLVALEDAIRDKPLECTMMMMSFPSTDTGESRSRRVVLGPTAHYVSAGEQAEDEEHPFCPCCLVTKSIAAFKPVFESDQTVGIRLFASIDANGEIAADCRVNGEDYPVGVEHLVEYAKTWPRRAGLEYRKQYVVVRSS